MVLLTALASRLISTKRPSRAMSFTIASPGAMRSGRSPRTGLMVSGPVQRISRGSSAGLVVGRVVEGLVVEEELAAANWRVVGLVVGLFADASAGRVVEGRCGRAARSPRVGRVVEERVVGCVDGPDINSSLSLMKSTRIS